MQRKITNALTVFLLQGILVLTSCNYISSSDAVQIALADSLLDKAYVSMSAIDMGVTTEQAIEALEISSKVQYYHGEVRAIYIIGKNLYNSGLYDEAFEYVSSIDRSRTKPEDAYYLAKIYLIKGEIHTVYQETNAALEAFDDAFLQTKNITDQTDRQYLLSQIYEAIAVIYNSLNHYDKGSEYLLRSHRLLEQMEEEQIIGEKIENYTLLGEQFLRFNQPDSSARWLERANVLIDKHDYPNQAPTLMVRARMLMLQTPPDIDSALEALFAARHNIDKTGMEHELSELYELIADAYVMKGQPDSVYHYMGLKNETETSYMEKNISSSHAMQDIVDNYHEQIHASMRRYFYYMVAAVLLVFTAIIINIIHKERRSRIKKIGISKVKK